MHDHPLRTFDVTICGIAELDGFCEHGMTHVLTILDPEFDDPEAFARFAPHERTILRFHDDVRELPGRRPPNEDDVRSLLEIGERLREHPDEGLRLLVHCHMGVSRSTAAVATILAHRFPGAEDHAFERIRQVRSFSWPNSRMIAIADRLLGRGGRLEQALRRHQREVLKLHPHIEELVVRIGREEELPDRR